MRANGTQFDITRHAHTLTGHGNQLAFMTDSEIGAELSGPDSERPGLADLRQREHVRDIGRSEPDRLYAAVGFARRAVRHHLQHGEDAGFCPACRQRFRCRPEQARFGAQRQICRQVGIGQRRWIGDRREGRDIARILIEVCSDSNNFLRNGRKIPALRIYLPERHRRLILLVSRSQVIGLLDDMRDTTGTSF